MDWEVRRKLVRVLSDYFEGPDEGMMPIGFPNKYVTVEPSGRNIEDIREEDCITPKGGELIAADVLDFIEHCGFKITEIEKET